MSAPTDKTEPKQSGLIPFKPGETGNPNGRPKGSRNKLGEAFLEALHKDFETDGVTAIVKMRADDPSGYVRVIASLLPKELKIETVNDLSDEQLDARIKQLAAALEIGIGGSAVGAPTTAEPQPPGEVSSVH